MELPKILHLARRMPPALFAQCHFYDLPDFLTWRATGSRARSHCSLVCKCAYVPPGVVADGGSSGWQPDLLRQLGLGQLVDEGYARLGGAPDGDGVILTAGQPVAQGLTAQAAAELGLLPGTAVGSALIDAYAGWVGTVAAPATNGPSAAAAVAAGLEASEGRLAAIAGTSTCHVLQSTQGIKVKGVWGPYKNAVFPVSRLKPVNVSRSSRDAGHVDERGRPELDGPGECRSGHRPALC
jgi:ribulose kinase